MTDHVAPVDMARKIVEQIVFDVEMLEVVGRSLVQLDPIDREQLVDGWVALVTEEFL